MTRNIRTLMVVATAVLLAAAATVGVYRAIKPFYREVPVAHYSAVVAPATSAGTLVAQEDVARAVADERSLGQLRQHRQSRRPRPVAPALGTSRSEARADPVALDCLPPPRHARASSRSTR
jgi:hypothetical protein